MCSLGTGLGERLSTPTDAGTESQYTSQQVTKPRHFVFDNLGGQLPGAAIPRRNTATMSRPENHQLRQLPMARVMSPIPRRDIQGCVDRPGRPSSESSLWGLAENVADDPLAMEAIAASAPLQLQFRSQYYHPYAADFDRHQGRPVYCATIRGDEPAVDVLAIQYRLQYGLHPHFSI